MEKLLHKRLREVANEYGWFRTGDEEQALQIDFAKALADEIERYYISRPRFEDGEPVQFGSVAQVRDDIGEVIKMVFNENGCEEVIIGFEYDSSSSHYMITDGEFVNRPTPNVYDADVVEIKEDDTLYGMGLNQHQYTVQKPYSINEEVGERFCVQCYDHDDGNIVWCDPRMLTHHEPDSLEKLRDGYLAIIEAAELLEQRYQQLEQVATLMYQFIEASVATDKPFFPQARDEFRDALEALGVSLDD